MRSLFPSLAFEWAEAYGLYGYGVFCSVYKTGVAEWVGNCLE